MKLFKLALTCFLVILLVSTITLNVLVLFRCGFIEVKEDEECPSISTDTSVQDIASEPSIIIDPDITITQNRPTSTPDCQTFEDKTSHIKVDTRVHCKNDRASNMSSNTEKVFYQDANIKITYLSADIEVVGPVYEFKIENLSDRPLSILFTDVYVDGYPVYVSGLTCSKLLPGKKAVDKFYLVESDWKEFTKNPSEVSFVIRLVDPDSYFTIYESERMMCRERLRGHKLFHQEHNHGSR